MLSTPNTIRTLQRKLYHKAKQDPVFRFYALYYKIYRDDILSHAYDLVCSNKGAPGIDGVTFKAIESVEGKIEYLVKLAEALKGRTYRAQATASVDTQTRWQQASTRHTDPTGPDCSNGIKACD